MSTTKSLWNGFTRLDFTFEGFSAILISPNDDNKCNKWLLKMEYFSAFQDFELEMVKRGWHLAFLENKSRWGKVDDLDRKARFAKFLSEEFGLYEKCVPVGMSCGGLMAIKFAASYPQYVSCMFLDAPVVNLLSCPANMGIAKNSEAVLAECLKNLEMTLSELICYREHPLDKIPMLVENEIPIIVTYGDADLVVPFCENGAHIEKAYKDAGKEIVTICVPGREHHPHGLEDNSPIIEFVLRHS